MLTEVNVFFICQANQRTAQFPKSAPKADVPDDGMKNWYANVLLLLNHSLWKMTKMVFLFSKHLSLLSSAMTEDTI